MIDWNFTPEHPITLTLAADARLGTTTYTNDQIWELKFGNSEPTALALQTTFGLRARICRIFPRFIFEGKIITDPAHFHRPIIIQKYYPNYIRMTCKPFSGINVAIEYWVPNSQAIAGRVKIENLSHDSRQVQLDWVEHLVPSPDGERMAIRKIGLSTVLTGRTSNLLPVLFITGGVRAGTGPYPSLNVFFDLPPNSVQESRWVNASLDDLNSSFELTKQLIIKNWEAEFAHIQRINDQGMEIITGNHEWNTAFFFAQNIANQLILQATESCKAPSFVNLRHPDQGFSRRKDGSDYSYLWNGQSAFDTYYLTNFILPSSPDTLRGLINNFLDTQNPQGEIDWKPGLGGQRSQILATPLLASLAWLYYEHTDDISYLKKIFNQLMKFFLAWFTDSHDRDNDHIPEWDQATQTGYEDNPLFSSGHPSSAGLDISCVESPDIISYLYHDGQSLISTAKLLGDHDAEFLVTQRIKQLKAAIDQTWSDQQAIYHYRDRDSHLTPVGRTLGVQMGSGVMEIHQEFPEPIRPQVIINSKKERTHPLQVYIHGTTPTGSHRVYHIPASRIRWRDGMGFITSEYVYSSIEHIEISGLPEDTEIIIRSVDLTVLDQTLLLPLWAGIPTNDQASILANLTILNKKKFLCQYGLRSIVGELSDDESKNEDLPMYFPWISLILEGLVSYGMQKQAAEVFTRLMNAVQVPLNQEFNFYHAYQSESGKPTGAANTLTGLLPVGLFLKILGIQIISPAKVMIRCGSPFPWPVTIKYRGLTVVQQEKKALIIFSDGQGITVENNQPKIITLRGVSQV
jgi:Mannosylglycerate hydrolase MGH1-like glycoside hydrolase domain